MFASFFALAMRSPGRQRLFRRTVVLDHGQVVADGPTEAIMADAALLATHGLEA